MYTRPLCRTNDAMFRTSYFSHYNWTENKNKKQNIGVIEQIKRQKKKKHWCNGKDKIILEFVDGFVVLNSGLRTE
jgi:hypothetical protein